MWKAAATLRGACNRQAQGGLPPVRISAVPHASRAVLRFAGLPSSTACCRCGSVRYPTPRPAGAPAFLRHSRRQQQHSTLTFEFTDTAAQPHRCTSAAWAELRLEAAGVAMNRPGHAAGQPVGALRAVLELAALLLTLVVAAQPQLASHPLAVDRAKVGHRLQACEQPCKPKPLAAARMATMGSSLDGVGRQVPSGGARPASAVVERIAATSYAQCLQCGPARRRNC